MKLTIVIELMGSEQKPDNNLIFLNWSKNKKNQ